MLRTALLKLSARLPCRLIKVNGEPYLERYYVGRLLGVTFYLHRIAAVGAGTWTLFFHGARQYVGGEPKGWGFLTPVDGGVMFAQYQSAAEDWWKTAPRGCDAGRAPL